jgi:hypothetical protein
MASETDRRVFISLIGWALLIASKAALLQFLVSLNFLRFWSFQWFISIVFIVGLFSGGLGILNMRRKDPAAAVPMIFGNFYLFAAIILYLFMGFYQSAESLTPVQFFGFALLGTVAVGTGYLSVRRGAQAYLRFPSYGFGIAGVLYVFMLMYKYVFSGHPFRVQMFFGEVFLILVGGALFYYFYHMSEQQG